MISCSQLISWSRVCARCRSLNSCAPFCNRSHRLPIKSPRRPNPLPVLHHKQAISQLCDRVLLGSNRLSWADSNIEGLELLKVCIGQPGTSIWCKKLILSHSELKSGPGSPLKSQLQTGFSCSYRLDSILKFYLLVYFHDTS